MGTGPLTHSHPSTAQYTAVIWLRQSIIELQYYLLFPDVSQRKFVPIGSRMTNNSYRALAALHATVQQTTAR